MSQREISGGNVICHIIQVVGLNQCEVDNFSLWMIIPYMIISDCSYTTASWMLAIEFGSLHKCKDENSRGDELSGQEEATLVDDETAFIWGDAVDIYKNLGDWITRPWMMYSGDYDSINRAWDSHRSSYSPIFTSVAQIAHATNHANFVNVNWPTIHPAHMRVNAITVGKHTSPETHYRSQLSDWSDSTDSQTRRSTYNHRSQIIHHSECI